MILSIAVVLVLLLVAWFSRNFMFVSRESLAGLDPKHDGVRDDVGRFIDAHYQDEKVRIVASRITPRYQGGNAGSGARWKESAFCD